MSRLRSACGNAAPGMLVLAALWLTGCTAVPEAADAAPAAAAAQPVQLANPASQRCYKLGGTLTIERRPDGGQYGTCVFEDNRQCEEWALFRGECRAGGVRITGYTTDAARFCAITGGDYTVMAGNASAERGTCTLPGGKSCDAEEYYRGKCGR